MPANIPHMLHPDCLHFETILLESSDTLRLLAMILSADNGVRSLECIRDTEGEKTVARDFSSMFVRAIRSCMWG
jgi:hypothetical protein